MSLRKTLSIGPVTWSYTETGEGSELWLAFHGFGQEAEVLQYFMRTLRPEARILSFDLPLHGETTMIYDELSVSNLADLFIAVLRQEKKNTCSLVGFSLGGKLVLKLVELAPAKIKQILLIAPDGLKVNPFYWLVTNTALGREFFKFIIHFPQPLFVAIRFLSSTGLLDRKTAEFLSVQMSTKEKRKKVLATWITFRRITPSLKDVRSKIWRYHINPLLVFGRYDRVIHPRLAAKLSGKKCSTAQVVMLETGHHLITKEHALELKERLTFRP